MTEAEVTADIRKYLDSKGIWHYKHFSSGRGHGRSKRGLPDIQGIYLGRYLGIEVKGSNGKLRPEQAKVGNEIIDHGGIFIVARSVEDVREGLRPYDRIPRPDRHTC